MTIILWIVFKEKVTKNTMFPSSQWLMKDIFTCFVCLVKYVVTGLSTP